MLTPSNYVTPMLVNKIYKSLQEIIEKPVTNEHRDKCTKYVRVAKDFMNTQFRNHASKDDDDCCLHGFVYTLSRHYIDRERYIQEDNEAIKANVFLILTKIKTGSVGKAWDSRCIRFSF